MMKTLRFAFFFIVAGLLAACSSHTASQAPGENTQAGQAQPTATVAPIANPIDFPLYSGSKVLASKDFTQSVNTKDGYTGGSVLSAGNGNYAGHEVIASTAASFGDLSKWVDGFDTTPPAGYTKVTSGDIASAREQAKKIGVDFNAFQKTDKGKHVGLLLVALDPTEVNRKLGSVLAMISKYKMLPAPMKSAIDDKVKAQTGFSITEATQPDSPIGATLDSLEDFQHSNARGIVLLSAVKQ
ncbi:MAG: hypothetical protein M3Y21_09875 [Candidatus Eremiobacteraeota bacterium]|nr:hypothetical protein [Candidatus Eremiobacteraeota bacterium]